MYLLMHTPVHIHRPLQVGFVEKATWSDELFEKYMEDCEKNRKAQCGRHYLSKREIERWGFMPPCGARFEVVELDLSWLPALPTPPSTPPPPPTTETKEDLENPSIAYVYTGKHATEMR